MANVTVTIDPRVLKRARIRAIEEGTSVNALVARYLERYAGADETVAAVAAFLELAEQSSAGSGPAGRQWTRDEANERAALR